MALFDNWLGSGRDEQTEGDVTLTTHDDIERYIRGAVRFVRTDDGLIQPYRFTAAQMEVLDRIGRHERAVATSGIVIDFVTDGDAVAFDCRVTRPLDRSHGVYATVMQHEGVLGKAEDGVIDGIDIVAGGLRSYTTTVTDGTIHLGFDNPERDRVEVRIFLPYIMSVAVGNLAVNGSVESAPTRGYLLALGDSITQGFVVGCPSLTYPARVATALKLDLVNQGIAGHVFDRRTLRGLDELRANPPRVITVAYGTNDWSRRDSARAIQRGAERYLSRLMRTFPGVPVYVMSPLWRADEQDGVAAGVSLAWVGSMLENLCAQRDNLHFVDGYHAIPQNAVMLADGRVHPGSVDAGLIADMLAERLEHDGVGETVGVPRRLVPKVEDAPAARTDAAATGGDARGEQSVAKDAADTSDAGSADGAVGTGEVAAADDGATTDAAAAAVGSQGSGGGEPQTAEGEATDRNDRFSNLPVIDDESNAASMDDADDEGDPLGDTGSLGAVRAAVAAASAHDAPLDEPDDIGGPSVSAPDPFAGLADVVARAAREALVLVADRMNRGSLDLAHGQTTAAALAARAASDMGATSAEMAEAADVAARMLPGVVDGSVVLGVDNAAADIAAATADIETESDWDDLDAAESWDDLPEVDLATSSELATTAGDGLADGSGGLDGWDDDEDDDWLSMRAIAAAINISERGSDGRADAMADTVADTVYVSSDGGRGKWYRRALDADDETRERAGAPTTHPEFDRLVRTIWRLRQPDDGCPWDLEQTHTTITGNMVEEAYEAVDAINAGDVAHLREELGDVLEQVLLHAQIAADDGEFTLDDVCRELNEKLVRRHPHVFGDLSASTPEEALELWREAKRAERRERGEQTGRAEGILDSVPRSLPALKQAQEVSTRAARLGFEWESVERVWEKVSEESAEFVREPRGSDEAKMEFGDLLFTLVNVARFEGIDAEEALAASTAKFRRRWDTVERTAHEWGREPQTLSPLEFDLLWEHAKSEENLGAMLRSGSAG